METSRLKQVYEFISEIVNTLEIKEENEKGSLHVEGQLYEARYILENIEEIIFKD